MNFNLLIIPIVLIILIVWFELSIKKLIKEKLNNEKIKNKNEQFELFNKINPDQYETYIEQYITRQLRQYIVFKFVSKKIDYINEAMQKQMVKDITKLVVLNISELYIYYIKMMNAIPDDDAFTEFIFNKVSTISITLLVDFNRAK